MQGRIATKPADFPSLLTAEEKPVVEIVNADGSAPIVLVCEHASNNIPLYFDNLGLSEAERQSHIAWDPGARTLAVALSRALDAPLVCSRISRLVFDCNRPANSPTAMPQKSEHTPVPGNLALSPAQTEARIEQVYQPFLYALGEVVARQRKLHKTPALITVHSFTPVFFGVERKVQIGLLHSRDATLARAMLEAADGQSDLRIELNQPYGPEDGVSHTLDVHGIKNGLPNVMIEVRNDMLGEPRSAAQIATTLEKLIQTALKRLKLTNGGVI
ncbi:MAG TPA: N-formylglutamate amidohydrolase [Devosia sp.]|nr:N-formylglutamate amidohydrolase [Devosia sp.]